MAPSSRGALWRINTVSTAELLLSPRLSPQCTGLVIDVQFNTNIKTAPLVKQHPKESLKK